MQEDRARRSPRRDFRGLETGLAVRYNQIDAVAAISIRAAINSGDYKDGGTD